MFIKYWKWCDTSTSKRMCFDNPIIAKCRLHTEIFPSTMLYDIGCTVAHIKTLGSTQLWYSMEDELLEIQGWHSVEVSQIFTCSQLHKLINLYIIIILYLEPVLIFIGFKFVSFCVINVFIFKVIFLCSAFSFTIIAVSSSKYETSYENYTMFTVLFHCGQSGCCSAI